jgi:hypothetical protein
MEVLQQNRQVTSISHAVKRNTVTLSSVQIIALSRNAYDKTAHRMIILGLAASIDVNSPRQLIAGISARAATSRPCTSAYQTNQRHYE